MRIAKQSNGPTLKIPSVCISQLRRSLKDISNLDVHNTLRFLELSRKHKFTTLSGTTSPVLIISGQYKPTNLEDEESLYDPVLGPFMKRFMGKIRVFKEGSVLSEWIGKEAEKRAAEIELKSYSDPLTMWEDITGDGCPAKNVNLLGLGGDEHEVEAYQMALALRAWVGLIRGTGVQADKILADKDWTGRSAYSCYHQMQRQFKPSSSRMQRISHQKSLRGW